MKTLTSTLIVLSAMLLLNATATAITMESIDARIGLGTQAGDFFDAGSGFTQGDTSHTNTMSFNDGVVQVDFQLTIEGFDANGQPAGLRVNSQAAGVELGVNNDQIDAGEKIKVTYDDVAFSIIGVPAMGFVDPGSFAALLSSIRLTAFTPVTDTFTYAGVGAASVTGDDTQTMTFLPPTLVANGDMFSITADSGSFRALFFSHSGNYKTVPEPASLALMAISLIGFGVSRSKR